jgi:hypothetical protein
MLWSLRMHFIHVHILLSPHPLNQPLKEFLTTTSSSSGIFASVIVPFTIGLVGVRVQCSNYPLIWPYDGFYSQCYAVGCILTVWYIALGSEVDFEHSLLSLHNIYRLGLRVSRG